jgi:hypothetical protein
MLLVWCCGFGGCTVLMIVGSVVSGSMFSAALSFLVDVCLASQ